MSEGLRGLVDPHRVRSGGLFVGRLVAESGAGTLLEALDLFPGARVDVIGTGPESARLSEHRASRSARARLRAKGARM